MAEEGRHATHLTVRGDWLATVVEPILDPALPIVDPHHHLWDRPGWPYLDDALLADVSSGHNIRSTIHVQCRMAYRPDGPLALRPVGETEYMVEVARKCDARVGNRVRVCEAIVAHADLRLGRDVQPVLEAQLQAGDGRVRGIRHSTAWDPDPLIVNPELGAASGMLGDNRFREGFGQLALNGLVFDAWVYHPQIDDVASLAAAFPDTTIVLGHAGGPVGIGRFAGRRDAVFTEWRAAMRRLAAHDNVVVKVGGLAMRISGRDFHLRERPPGSADAAREWAPIVSECIEAFGTKRCMFESNFPVDKASISYPVLWNAFKRLAAGYSEDEKADLFWRSAARVYRLAPLSALCCGDPA